MDHLFPIYGFVVDKTSWFDIGGVRYHLGATGVRTLELLADLYVASLAAEGREWLLPLRDQIREIESLNCRAALMTVVDRAPDANLRRLAIWMRGRCGGYLGKAELARHSADFDPAIRKELARCLKRLSAWPELRMMERFDPDARVRRFASQPQRKSYADRLRSFSSHVARRKVSTSETQLLVANDVDFQAGRPPKPDWMIRLILERIHRLVAGLPSPKKLKPPPL